MGEEIGVVSGGSTESALQRLESLVSAEAQRVLAAIEEKYIADRFREGQISRLHDELQGHRSNLVEKAILPLLQGVIRLHDEVGKICVGLRARDPADLAPEQFFAVISGFQDDLEVLLSQHGVDAFREPGEQFDVRRQIAARGVPAPDPSCEGRVAERLRPGFEKGPTLLQKERVVVYVKNGSGS